MSSTEEMKLKSETNRKIIEIKKEKKNKIKEEKTTTNEKIFTNKTSPLINIRQISSLSESFLLPSLIKLIIKLYI